MKRLQRVVKPPTKSIQRPARTRFAPSPTGVVHLGSLRTALYNFLLARATGGQFLLRLEDTDQKRLVQGAEENIYKSLKWAGLDWDEGPQMATPVISKEADPANGSNTVEPVANEESGAVQYRQSDRREIYAEHVQQLLDQGKAYRCFCSHERLDGLSKSARELRPPSTASYDRKCSHIDPEEAEKRALTESHVVRFKSPTTQDGSEAPNYPSFTDELHGPLTIQPQVNPASPRYDDFVISKSDGLPTYHFANVVDDHLMRITHVIRGEEWLASTPKHVALYQSFGWTPPKFVHIPLLMGDGGKKLSKRKSALGVLEYEDKLLPESFVNFVALLGWSPANRKVGSSINEVMNMPTLIKQFSLEGLTRGNVQVDMQKLAFFDQEHFKQALSTDLPRVAEICNRELPYSIEQTMEYLTIMKNHVTGIEDFRKKIQDVLGNPSRVELEPESRDIVTAVYAQLEAGEPPLDVPYSKRSMFPILRKVLVGGKSGNTIQEIIAVLGDAETKRRLKQCL